MNKKNIIGTVIAFLLVSLALVPVVADEMVDVWMQVYQDASNDSQRNLVIIKIQELRNKDFAPMLLEALADLHVRGLETGTSTEQFDKLTLAKRLIQELGNLQAADAGRQIFTFYRDGKDPDLKSIAAIALGKIRAMDYAGQLARDLADINLIPNLIDPKPQEKVAVGIIQAMESMRADIGFEPVFLASVAWYSQLSGIKKLSAVAVEKMITNYGDSLGQIIGKNPQISVKIRAIEAVQRSTLPNEQKNSIGRTALRVALDAAVGRPENQAEINRLKVISMGLLMSSADKNASTAELFIELVRRDDGSDRTLDDTLKSLTGLGINGSESAVTFLNNQLLDYNERQKAGKNTDRDVRLIRELLASIKRIKSPSSQAVLFRTKFVEQYDTSVLRDVNDALKVYGN